MTMSFMASLFITQQKNVIQIASSGKFLGCVGVSGVHMFVRVCAYFFLILLILESQE